MFFLRETFQMRGHRYDALAHALCLSSSPWQYWQSLVRGWPSFNTETSYDLYCGKTQRQTWTVAQLPPICINHYKGGFLNKLEPCLLQCFLWDLPVERLLSPEEVMRQPIGVHSDVAKPSKSAFFNLLFDWRLITPFQISLDLEHSPSAHQWMKKQ